MQHFRKSHFLAPLVLALCLLLTLAGCGGKKPLLEAYTVPYLRTAGLIPHHDLPRRRTGADRLDGL